MAADRTPVVESVKVERGPAGSLSAGGTVRYPGEESRAYAFHGNVYGGPVAYTFRSFAPGGPEWVSGFVTDGNTRFGVPFHEGPEEWVRRYFA